MERVAERYRQHGEVSYNLHTHTHYTVRTELHSVLQELRAKLRAGLEQEREIAKRNEERRLVSRPTTSLTTHSVSLRQKAGPGEAATEVFSSAAGVSRPT